MGVDPKHVLLTHDLATSFMNSMRDLDPGPAKQGGPEYMAVCLASLGMAMTSISINGSPARDNKANRHRIMCAVRVALTSEVDAIIREEAERN